MLGQMTSAVRVRRWQPHDGITVAVKVRFVLRMQVEGTPSHDQVSERAPCASTRRADLRGFIETSDGLVQKHQRSPIVIASHPLDPEIVEMYGRVMVAAGQLPCEPCVLFEVLEIAG